MRVLMLCDDEYHPGEIPIKGIKPLQAKGFQFDIISDASDFKKERLADYPVVLKCKCDHITQKDLTSWKSDEVQQAFVDFVERGGGLLVVHSGAVAGTKTDTTKLDKLVGSKFSFHPNATTVTVDVVKPHPITEGVGVFCEEDEHYHLDILSDDIDIIMASYGPPQGAPSLYAIEPRANAAPKISPAGYVRTQGKGRVCYLTPGHTLDVWLNPNFQRALENALNWLAGK